MNNQLMPSKDLLDELLRQVLTAKKDAELKIELSKEFEIRRYKDEAYLVRKNQQDQKNYEIVWKGESEILLPNGSKLKFKKVKGRGISLEKMTDKKLIISNRKGGEFFKPDSKRPTKKLKQLLQESDLPPWEREFLPLIFASIYLVFVPHLGISYVMKPKRTEKGLEIELIH
jgi:tRNA(Ile)-lysidine synthase